MSANSGILKDKNNQDFYPHSYAELIHTQDGSNVESKLRNLFNLFYPIGSIYMSATLDTAEEVEELFGGTWVAWGSGRVPVGVDENQTQFNTVEKQGGSKDMQKHNHDRGTMEITGTFAGRPHATGSNIGGALINGDVSGAFTYGSHAGSRNDAGVAESGSLSKTDKITFKASNSWTGNTSDAGDGESGNLQPYITCYMYKRIA